MQGIKVANQEFEQKTYKDKKARSQNLEIAQLKTDVKKFTQNANIYGLVKATT